MTQSLDNDKNPVYAIYVNVVRLKMHFHSVLYYIDKSILTVGFVSGTLQKCYVGSSS